MYNFIIKAKPQPELEGAAEIGGAYVICWINFALQDGAELLARYYIDQAKWIPELILEGQWVTRDHYDGSDSLQYYLEAEKDGASLVFSEWPVGAEDADDEVEDLQQRRYEALIDQYWIEKNRKTIH